MAGRWQPPNKQGCGNGPCQAAAVPRQAPILLEPLSHAPCCLQQRFPPAASTRAAFRRCRPQRGEAPAPPWQVSQAGAAGGTAGAWPPSAARKEQQSSSPDGGLAALQASVMKSTFPNYRFPRVFTARQCINIIYVTVLPRTEVGEL